MNIQKIDGTIPESATILNAVKVIEEFRKTMAVVINKDRKVIGAVTDGDVRRAIIEGHNINSSITNVMNRNPIMTNSDESDAHLLEILTKYDLEAIPLIDSNKNFVRIIHITDLSKTVVSNLKSSIECAVIMAGGEGRRLLPLTQELPKPMIKVGGMPIIERQIRCLSQQGIKKIFITINYLGNVIRDYFGDGSLWDVSIKYIEEETKLGTAGALSLLPHIPNSPVLVINGDVLTTSDYNKFLDFHLHHKAHISLSTITYQVDIPYGVIFTNGPRAVRLEEKPSQTFFCNAGIYLLSPAAMREIPNNQHLNMTELIETEMKKDKHIIIFPLHEYWSDIGTHSELEKARKLIETL